MEGKDNKEKEENQKKVSNAKKDEINKLATNLFENEESLDFGSIIKVASNLVNDQELLDTVKNIGKTNPSELGETNTEESEANLLEDLVLKITEIRDELKIIKEQNTLLLEKLSK
ncbi:hypothetical protein GLW05_03005 [Pontibacillus yanchengensis]|uniref:Uncharacterized protein n=1 Tax=Pontibacillus yanchengensis TaxID=462910 RepID=A0A6I5A306_9BACI|nr:hypothetical protein [Pontibacillus yanchengensis]MYL32559.1 hypothetical protein [Pontibacillus yanchengensis]